MQEKLDCFISDIDIDYFFNRSLMTIYNVAHDKKDNELLNLLAKCYHIQNAHDTSIDQNIIDTHANQECIKQQSESGKSESTRVALQIGDSTT